MIRPTLAPNMRSLTGLMRHQMAARTRRDRRAMVRGPCTSRRATAAWAWALAATRPTASPTGSNTSLRPTTARRLVHSLTAVCDCRTTDLGSCNTETYTNRIASGSHIIQVRALQREWAGRLLMCMQVNHLLCVRLVGRDEVLCYVLGRVGSALVGSGRHQWRRVQPRPRHWRTRQGTWTRSSVQRTIISCTYSPFIPRRVAG
jgi:hypothetical protein